MVHAVVGEANHAGRVDVKGGPKAGVNVGARVGVTGRRATLTRVSWSWRYERADGEPVDASGSGVAELLSSFPTQSDAESWLGEEWRSLLAGGVDRVTLLEGDRVVYGPMNLDPAAG
jgi:hypothetical protein